jgi:hypothetical protein
MEVIVHRLRPDRERVEVVLTESEVMKLFLQERAQDRVVEGAHPSGLTEVLIRVVGKIP